MNTPQKQGNALSFDNLGIANNLLIALSKRNFRVPTPIQHQVIPPALEGKDVVGIAQTGTGKTLAFGIPLIQRLSKVKGQGLIILPTRELALQVNEALESVGKQFGLRTVVLIGGAPMRPQIQQLNRNPHVVVATPGRLADHIKQKNYSLQKVSIVVLDEADRMLDIGFQKEITQILKDSPKEKQTMLFSATMPPAIAKMAASYMKMPLRIEVSPQGSSPTQVEQELFIVKKENKLQLLDKILSDNNGTALVFSRTKHGAKKIAAQVRAMGHTVTEIHSNRSLNQRKMAMFGFKTGRYRVLIATDIAARGIDVQNISMVINFDLPDNSEDYVHRIGRTGRAGAFGKAISFATSSERADVKKIERLIRKSLPILQVPSDLPAPRGKGIKEVSEYSGYRGDRVGGARSSNYRGKQYLGGGEQRRSGNSSGGFQRRTRRKRS